MNTLTSRLLLSGILALTAAGLGHAAGSYRFLHEIPVGGEGGWDYLSVDPAAHRLYVSHATKVVVIDTQTDQIVGEIADTPGIHGIAVAPKFGRAFTSNGKENKAGIVDLTTLKTLEKVETGPNPDAILFEPGQGEIYTFNGRGANATVISVDTGKVTATIPLGGKPEFAQADPAAHRVFVNIEDKNEVAVIDTQTHAVTARWPIAPGEEASGMDIDLIHHRLFLGCSNAKLIVLDETNGRVVASLSAGQGIDAAAFDPGTQLAFTSNGRDGTVTVVHEDSPDKFTVVQTLKTEPSARTMTVDPVSHKIYLAAARFEAPVAGSTQRPKMIAGTFKVLVYELSP
jgi:DNA-binding beta-propeller fold protein YncE